VEFRADPLRSLVRIGARELAGATVLGGRFAEETDPLEVAELTLVPTWRVADARWWDRVKDQASSVNVPPGRFWVCLHELQVKLVCILVDTDVERPLELVGIQVADHLRPVFGL